MATDKIRVTVDGEPVSVEVNWDDVRSYLRARGVAALNRQEQRGGVVAQGHQHRLHCW